MLQRITSYKTLYRNKITVMLVEVRSFETLTLVLHKFSGYHAGCYLNGGLLGFDVITL
jgi:hypothetical protein